MSPTPKLTLFRGFAATPNYIWSPFGTKLEMRLRLAGLPYTLAVGSLRTAPRGKIPYISVQDEAEGTTTILGDTTLIAKQFVANGLLPDLNADLTPVQRAQDLAIRSLLEEKVCFYNMRERWVDNYYTMRDGVLAALPYPMQLIIGVLAQRGAKRTLYGQGTGRLEDDEVRELGKEAWEAVSDLLAGSRSKAASKEEPFWILGRTEPTEADTTVFGFIISGLICDAGPQSQKLLRSMPVLEDYARRIHYRYFPDYTIWDAEV